METERFVNDYIKGRKITQSTVRLLNPKIDSYQFRHIRSLKGFINFINFDCQIDTKTGGCKENKLSRKCCCHDCTNNIGYLVMMLLSDLKYYSRRFSPKTGFWKPGKGCILSHHMRSITCLTHHCNYKSKDNPYFSGGVYQVKMLMKQHRKTILDLDDELHSRK